MANLKILNNSINDIDGLTLIDDEEALDITGGICFFWNRPWWDYDNPPICFSKCYLMSTSV